VEAGACAVAGVVVVAEVDTLIEVHVGVVVADNKNSLFRECIVDRYSSNI
jgi:hypothetical protein